MTQCYYFRMHCAGFVLAGGHSTRMGRDKALLPYGSGTLIEAVADNLATVVNQLALIGDPVKYGGFGYPVYPDRISESGPLGGLHTALRLDWAEWNLVVACDMPRLPRTLFSTLLERADALTDPRLACVVPVTEAAQPEPLCAVYHSSCLPAVERALLEKRRKMKVLLSELKCVWLPGWPSRLFTNVNTPEEWTGFKADGAL